MILKIKELSDVAEHYILYSQYNLCLKVLKSYLMVWNIIDYIHNNLCFMILKIKELSDVAEHYITFNIIFV